MNLSLVAAAIDQANLCIEGHHAGMTHTYKYYSLCGKLNILAFDVCSRH